MKHTLAFLRSIPSLVKKTTKKSNTKKMIKRKNMHSVKAIKGDKMNGAKATKEGNITGAKVIKEDFMTYVKTLKAKDSFRAKAINGIGMNSA